MAFLHVLWDIDHTAACLLRADSGSPAPPPVENLSHLNSRPNLCKREGFLQPRPDWSLADEDDEDEDAPGEVEKLGHLEEYLRGREALVIVHMRMCEVVKAFKDPGNTQSQTDLCVQNLRIHYKALCYLINVISYHIFLRFLIQF